MSTQLFLSVKYAIETAALCWLLSFAVMRSARRAFQAVYRRLYIFPISGVLQEMVYIALGTDSFPALYVFWNYAALWLFWRLGIRCERRFSAVWISYSLILFQLCQIFTTCLIFTVPALAKRVADFGQWEIGISTFLIWLIGTGSAAISCGKLPEIVRLSFRESLWAHIFLWFAFAAEHTLPYTFTEEQTRTVMAALFYAFIYVDVQIFYFSFMQSATERNEKLEQIRMKQQYAIQLQHYKEINVLYQRLREIRHEENNRLLYIEQMLTEGQYDALKQYFGKTKEELTPVLEMRDYGNRLINAVLWSKRESAVQEGIPIDICVAVPEDIPIEGHDLCSLLGNLLDNAIEGSKGVREPHIRVTMRMQRSYLYCCVSNCVDTDIFRENPELFTTKQDAQNHGYGIKTVRRIAEHYQGMADFAIQNGEFTASVMLLCKERISL